LISIVFPSFYITNAFSLVYDILDKDKHDIARLGLQKNLLESFLFCEIDALFVTKQVTNDDHWKI
jgi:hypothetical protein